VKVGVIGAGSMGKNHIRVLLGMESVEAVAVYDPISVDQLVMNGVSGFQDLGEFLESGLDYCVISSPTSTHMVLGVELAKRGIPSLVEKPLAMNSDHGIEIVKAFESQGLFGAVGHIERFNPASIALRAKLREGVIGNALQITTRRVGPYSGRIHDVGAVKDLASHDIDLVSWLTNSTYEWVSSLTLSPLGNAHEDGLLALARMKDGTPVQHTVNWISPIKERVTLVLGEAGMLVADTLNGDLYLHQNGTSINSWVAMSQLRGNTEGTTVKFELPRVEPLVAEHMAFQRALLTGETGQIATLDEGLEVLRVAERLVSSSM
jgi:UDP-N-acetylglucosamine 3-dehydrogenase